MRHILSKDCIDILAQFAASRLLLALDYDGTLAPIVNDRNAAHMRTRTSALLSRVCELYPCAVISGRSREDVHGRVGGANLMQVVGNHGLEPGMRLEQFAQDVSVLKPQLTTMLSGLQGLDIEDKCYSLAIHYRKSRSKRNAKVVIAEAVARLPKRVRVIEGKSVLNILPLKSPHKGDALTRLRAEAGMDTALYVGDDTTDEDIFAIDDPGRLLTIRVGYSRKSAASYYLRNQNEIDRLLSLLASARSPRKVPG